MNKKGTTRKERREELEKLQLGWELVRLIRHFFPDLITQLKGVTDQRHKSYIRYENHVILMTRILASIFYISSMRKTSEEFNDEKVIANIGYLCGRGLEELPYWETINLYLEKVPDEDLQQIICKLVKGLLRSRAFENARIRGRYWQVIVDGTQINSSRKELDGGCLYRIHKRGTAEEYVEYYYYVLEAKLYLHKDIYVSIMTEFVENKDSEAEKQDCERKAAKRLMERLKAQFPMLRILFCADSLYACEGIFQLCLQSLWSFLIRYKKGSIPSVYQEYESLRKQEKNYREYQNNGLSCWYDHVCGIDYNGYSVNLLEYGDSQEKHFCFLTDLPITMKNRNQLLIDGRRRWAIENHGFNTQKNHGFFLEHLFSRNGQAMKNHYLLIQIAHMISQLLDAWKKLWKNLPISREQKHRRLLESWKQVPLSLFSGEDAPFQIRFL